MWRIRMFILPKTEHCPVCKSFEYRYSNYAIGSMLTKSGIQILFEYIYVFCRMNYPAASGWILKNNFYQNNRCILCWIASIFRGICEIGGKKDWKVNRLIKENYIKKSLLSDKMLSNFRILLIILA